jgi:hypothetical protein
MTVNRIKKRFPLREALLLLSYMISQVGLWESSNDYTEY